MRLLDFGIAKQLEDLEAPGDSTQTQLRLLTPAYASPEQIRGERIGVFTDVYALGVILYELLAKRLPFDLSIRSPGEAERLILEEEPDSPSAAAPPSAREELRPSAWADLDVLCLTAMHKVPERRYASVDALIRDVDHYLKGKPLEARPDSWGYKTGKFVQRNRRAVAGVSAALLIVVSLAIFFTFRLAQARDAALASAARADEFRSS